MSERSQREGFRPGCYGPVQINGGDHEGKIGYYDDDDEPGIAIVDPGDFFVAEGYYLIPFKYLFPATVHALIERRQELMGYIFDITHQDGIHDEDYRELYKLMSELHYVDLQIADINFHGRFGKQTSKGKKPIYILFQ